ncbi:MAG TPA: hypothetical protein VL360_04045 [Gammaproteobacteria bacterium]|nr:hypothetical protein [Gammaproteobacteria bacterium]
MRKISFLFLFVLSMLGCNAFALEGHGFRLISSTIETSPGAKGWFKPTSDKKSSKVAMTRSIAYDAEGYAGMNIMLRGSHSVSITNYTNQNQIYTYKYEINCDGQYFRKVDRVEVRPGGVANENGDSYLSTYHRTKGFFSINVATEVAGESSNRHVNSATLRVIG